MKKLRLGQNVAIFILFFGIALLDAFKSGSLWEMLFWVVLGTLFFLADNLKRT